MNRNLLLSEVLFLLTTPISIPLSGLIANRKSTPILYGLVENPAYRDVSAATCLRDDQTFMIWMISGEAEWIDKTNENIIKCVVVRKTKHDRNTTEVHEANESYCEEGLLETDREMC